MMPAPGSRRPVILGAATRTLLIRRRKWIRWLAILVAAFAVISIVLQFHHSRTSRHPLYPAAVVRHAIHAGQVLGKSDVEMVMMDTELPGLMSPVRSPDIAGRVAVRDLGVGDYITADATEPFAQYFGISAHVPPGMRAVNLVVPSAEIFGGDLAPLSRVDVLGAFEVGQDRAAATLLTSGIVLRIAETPTRRPSEIGRASGPLAQETGQAAPVEIEVAVPEATERQIVLAQAFGRILLAVHPATEPVHAAAAGVLNLRKYLDLPPASRMPVITAARPSISPTPTFPSAGHTSANVPGPRTAASHVSSAKARSSGGSPAPATGGTYPAATDWVVEMIRGGTRSLEMVPRSDGADAPAERTPSSGR